MLKIVAFGHRKHVGKDTACNFLATAYRLEVRNSSLVKKGFADKVKDIAYEIFSWTGLQPGEFYEREENYHLKDVPLPLTGKTPRYYWISVGNKLREIDDTIWERYLLDNTKAQILLVKDMRFPVEAEAILARGGRVYRIDRDDQPKVTDGADDPLENWTGWTGILTNNGTLHEFYDLVIKEVFPWLIS